MKKIVLIVLAILPLCLLAQRRSRDTYTPAPDEQTLSSDVEYGDSGRKNSNSYNDYNDNGYNERNNDRSSRNKEPKEHKKVFTGFSGGMMIHGGYSFASSPDELFRNESLTPGNVKDLPKDGFTMGLGGTLRLHLIDHIHLGGEGHVSFMPLTKSGTSIRTGWGGAMCDFYGTIGIVRPLIGLCVGGGSTKRLYVPEDAETTVEGGDKVVYNASYTVTPFFLLDPYAGLEIALSKIMLYIRVDYMLPFGKSKDGLMKTDVSWSNFVSPSGPRLYVGVLFGH